MILINQTLSRNIRCALLTFYYRELLTAIMHVSLKDKENSSSRQRISHLIEPVRMTQRSQRKVLQQLFPDNDNQSITDQQPGVKITISDCGRSTRKQCMSRVISSDVVFQGTRIAGLQRQLEQTRAIMRLEEGNKEKKIEILSQKVETLRHELEVTHVQTRRYQQRCDHADQGLYDLERKLIDKEIEIAAQFQHKIMQLEVALHAKEKELITCSTDNSKTKYDMHHEILLDRQQIERLKQMLAEKDFRLMDLETKSTIERAELESKLESALKSLSQAQQLSHSLQLQLSQLLLLQSPEPSSKLSSLELQLQSREDTIRILKQHIQRLSNVESENDELRRNEKKLVRRYAQLQRQMIERNEKVNEIVLGYQGDIDKAKIEETRIRSLLLELENKNSYLQHDIQKYQDQLNKVSKELNNLSLKEIKIQTKSISQYSLLEIQHQSTRRDLEISMKSMQEMRERQSYQISIKDDKIILLNRQLTEKESEISRLSNVIKINQEKSYSIESTKILNLESQLISVSQQLKSTQQKLQSQIAQQHSASLQIQLNMKNDQITQLNRIIESQSLTLHQARKTLAENETILQMKNSELIQISVECKRLQVIVTQTQILRREEQQFKKDFQNRFAGSTSISQNSATNIRQALILKMNELESTKGLLSELTLTNRLLRESNGNYIIEIKTLNHRIQDMYANQRLNQELIIKIQQESKLSRQRLQQSMQQEYEILYEKYIKYRRILQKDKDRKQLQRAIIKDSNEFNEKIAEKCRQIIK